jgi:hypothetical protein
VSNKGLAPIQSEFLASWREIFPHLRFNVNLYSTFAASGERRL